jgi:hypothetical protein
MAPLIRILPICFALAGCGTFQLASSVSAPSNKNTADMRLDILDCKDRARTYANGPEKQARAFALGFTIIGAPVAFAAERSDQRSAFRDCMQGRGYSVAGVK